MAKQHLVSKSSMSFDSSAHGHPVVNLMTQLEPGTAAALGLESTQASLGVRWTGERSVWRLKIGRSRGDYESPDPRLDFFQNLYGDRHWTLVQLSYSHTF